VEKKEKEEKIERGEKWAGFSHYNTNTATDDTS
jgi:hypothetical protein